MFDVFKKYGKVSILFLFVLVSGWCLYFKELEQKMNISVNVYDEYSLAVYIDDVVSKNLPKKEDGYIFDEKNSSCTNGANLLWDSDIWGPVIHNLVNSQTHCNIYFKKFYTEAILNGADPVMKEELIPVMIQDDGTVTTAELGNAWYSYENKQWANAVLVKSNGTKTRDYYFANEGEEVASDDILAYFVWIPRYSYKVWTDDIASNDTTPNEIEITFHDTTTTYTSPNSDKYLTHPVFWWDNNSDGTRKTDEEILGIWVAKFEVSQQSVSESGTIPTILPNQPSLVSLTLFKQFEKMLSFAGGEFDTTTGNVIFAGSSTYGLSSSVDSHMMKNSEWGAVAYLSHSQYGINSEIRANNYYKSGSYLTGCGAASGETSNVTDCSIKYGSSSEYPQSSTGNISGVFDMSGGAWDRLMANYNNKVGDSEFSIFPNSKYYDLYNISSLSSCTYLICAGYATSETYGWYSNLANFVNSNYPWFVRGGAYNEISEAGIFNFGRNTGYASSLSTTRVVLIVK